jgi:broad specificity phosphatase PhoE
MRRWRGSIDVPLTREGRIQALDLYTEIGKLDAIYSDGLSRCRDTAQILNPFVYFDSEESGPWRMGHLFEGREITDDSLNLAQHYINNPFVCPPGGETFQEYYERWMGWLEDLKNGFAAIGVVTHNRNIQTAYACQHGEFSYQMYDCDGPGFCSVHYYDRGRIAPWGGKNVPKGIYLIRHGATEWGT